MKVDLKLIFARTEFVVVNPPIIYFLARFLFRSQPSAGIWKVMCNRSSISMSAFFGIRDTAESARDKRSANSS